jgi:hypothetical protein
MASKQEPNVLLLHAKLDRLYHIGFSDGLFRGALRCVSILGGGGTL